MWNKSCAFGIMGTSVNYKKDLRERIMNFKEIYFDDIERTDSALDNYTDSFVVKDPNSSIYGKGAHFDMMYDTSPELWSIRLCLSGYCCKDSRYYKNPNLLKEVSERIKVCRTKLNEDGTNTMFQSNFRTGDQFALEGTAYFLLIMFKTLSDDAYENQVFDELCCLVEDMARGCLNGGFHTPNHRWVESSGLLLTYYVLSKTKRTRYTEAMLEKAKKYLAEGVDCDEYGEWSERSAGMYNIHCDNAFLNIYYVLQDREYLDCVSRNLELMTHYIEDDLSVFTQNSRRKDKGELGTVQTFSKARHFYADLYIEPCSVVGFLNKDNRMASLAYKIYKDSRKQGRAASIPIYFFIMYPEMIDWEFEYIKNPLPKTFEHYLPNSNIVRKKTDLATYTFLAKNPAFFHIESSGINMRMRLCSSFFAIAQFVPQEMEKTENGYRMTMTAHAEYKLPLDNPDGITTKNYWSIDYSKRKSIQEIDYRMSVEAVFVDDGVDLTFSLSGCDKVPTKVEMFLDEGLRCEIGNAVMITKAGANAFSRGDTARLESENGTVMEISGLFCKHLYTSDMRGSLNPIDGAFVLYATDFSPFEKTIRIRVFKTNERKVFF